MTDADRNQRILDAAAGLFLQNGLRATTMEAVAKAAGVAKPTLYSRFPDKESLFRAIGTSVMQGYRITFDQALAAPGTPVDRITAAIAAKHAAYHQLLGTSSHADEILADHFRLNADGFAQLQQWVVTRVTEVLADSGLPDAAERARLILAAIEGIKAEFSPQDLARLTPLVVRRLLD